MSDDSFSLSTENTHTVKIKGYCKDCLFYTQDWHLDWTKDKDGTIQMYLELDKYCILCNIFKRPDGFCDLFELP
jgi:hypothetical protein